ncbi:MAG: hypothetical protein IKO12_07575 [Bacteroidaceae bacterium]|nr:hypothetical protein [Bacteroidaceae bacterium]
MRLLFFNPEHDLALASGNPHYTPPASALAMATRLQDLPRCWAGPDDLILRRDGTVTDAAGQVLFSAADPWSARVSSVLPWGWDPLVVQQLRALGIHPSCLPTDSWLSRFRHLSGRATAATLLQQVRQRCQADARMVGEAFCCHTMEQAEAVHARLTETIFKQPWSGSGRGLHPAHGGRLDVKTEAWLRRTLRQQGYVMAEPFYDKVQDLAAEFWLHPDGRIAYEGLSLFQTTAGGVYAGNLVAPEQDKRQRLACHIPLGLLDAAIGHLQQLLAQLLQPLQTESFPQFQGPLGVDMMVVRHDGALALHPCVEVNFRMTMGWVALHGYHFFC